MWPTGDTGLMPLDIVGLPDYEKLSEPERVLCTELRSPAVWVKLFVSSLNMPQVAAICFCTASSKTWGMTPNKALLADQWYYILYFVSWSASLIQRRRHHRKGACCWQRQGKLWGSMSIRRGARTSWAHIFVYIDSKAPRQCFGLLFTFRKVFDLLVTEGVIQARLQWFKEKLLWPIFCAIQSCNFRLHHFIPPVFWD